MKSTVISVLLVFGVALLVGCSDSTPPGPSLGGATVTKYVAVGNSLTAGYQSNALYASAQAYSYPNLIAQQIKLAGANLGTFEQPLYGDPGNADPLTGKAARMELISFTGPIIGPRGLTPGTPTNTALARPYDNLGMPGIPLAGFMDTTTTYTGSFRDLVLRPTGFTTMKSQFLQTVAQNPDLVTFWLGANDVLGFATTGGVSPSAPTPSGTFAFLYNQALDTLRKALPNAKIIVANIPEVTAIPFFTTVGPKIKAGLPAGVALYFQKRGEAGVGSGSSLLTGAAGTPLVTLKGGTYAALIGTQTFKPYRDLGMTYAAAAGLGMDSTKPFGLHPQNPFPNPYVLDSLEQAMASDAIAAFNATIASVATARGAAVVDIHGIFNDIVVNGYGYAGAHFTSAYVVGGLFSYDGVHPSSRGAGVVANEFIKVMNSTFGTKVPLVNIVAIPGLDAPTSKAVAGGIPQIDPAAWRSFDALFQTGNDQ